jgi:hypothetical protein
VKTPNLTCENFCLTPNGSNSSGHEYAECEQIAVNVLKHIESSRLGGRIYRFKSNIGYLNKVNINAFISLQQKQDI